MMAACSCYLQNGVTNNSTQAGTSAATGQCCRNVGGCCVCGTNGTTNTAGTTNNPTRTANLFCRYCGCSLNRNGIVRCNGTAGTTGTLGSSTTTGTAGTAGTNNRRRCRCTRQSANGCCRYCGCNLSQNGVVRCQRTAATCQGGVDNSNTASAFVGGTTPQTCTTLSGTLGSTDATIPVEASARCDFWPSFSRPRWLSCEDLYNNL